MHMHKNDNFQKKGISTFQIKKEKSKKMTEKKEKDEGYEQKTIFKR